MDTIKKYLEIPVRMGNVYHLRFHLSISRCLEPKVHNSLPWGSDGGNN